MGTQPRPVKIVLAAAPLLRPERLEFLVLEADEFQQIRVNEQVLVDRDGPWSGVGLGSSTVTSMSRLP